MHHLSTVNLDTLSEFITTGVSFFVFLFVCFFLTVTRAVQVHTPQTKPDPLRVPGPACGVARCLLHPVPLLSADRLVSELSILLCFIFQARSVEVSKFHSDELTLVSSLLMCFVYLIVQEVF